MKTLPQIVDDMRALAAFLMDNAGQIEELATFFGGTAAVAAPPPAADPPPLRARKLPDLGSRKLSKEDKAAIKTDWELFPKHLRTPENRKALSAKYKCAPLQIFALTREDGHQARIVQKSRDLTATPVN